MAFELGKNEAEPNRWLVGAARGLLLTSLAAGLTGCPKKLTERVEVPVPRECPAGGPPAPTAKAMTALTVIKHDGSVRAVLGGGAGSPWVALVAAGDRVGADKATVAAIDDGMVALKLADGSNHVLTVGAVANVAAGTPTPAVAPGTPAAPPSKEDALALAKWRQSVLQALAAGQGIPHDALLVVGLALSDNKLPPIAEATNKFGWTPLPGIETSFLVGLKIDNGQLTLDGVAPEKRFLDALVERLRAAAPYVVRVKVSSQAPGQQGFHFQLQVDLAVLKSADLAIAKAPGGHDGGTLPEEAKQLLSRDSERLPTDPRLDLFENEIKGIAAPAGLQQFTLTRVPEIAEDGYLGVVSFTVEAVGNTRNALVFFAKLREASPKLLAIDPFECKAGRITATLRVPFVRGKADARAPTPASLATSAPTGAKWDGLRKIEPIDLRDPFSH